jgi:Skp family chaperone for outer membrane proteins
MIWLALPVLPVMTWLGLNAQGNATPPSAVAFVSNQRIAKETADGKALFERIRVAQRTQQGAIKAKQDALDATRKQLAAATAESRARLQALGQQQTLELQSTVVKAQSDLQAIEREVNSELLKKVQVAVVNVVKDKQIQVVLNSDSAIVWASPTLDLSDAVIARMNAAPAPR